MVTRALVRRVELALRRSVTLADLMAQLAEVHGAATFVTEELSPGRIRTLTYAEAADRSSDGRSPSRRAAWPVGRSSSPRPTASTSSWSAWRSRGPVAFRHR